MHSWSGASWIWGSTLGFSVCFSLSQFKFSHFWHNLYSFAFVVTISFIIHFHKIVLDVITYFRFVAGKKWLFSPYFHSFWVYAFFFDCNLSIWFPAIIDHRTAGQDIMEDDIIRVSAFFFPTFLMLYDFSLICNTLSNIFFSLYLQWQSFKTLAVTFTHFLHVYTLQILLLVKLVSCLTKKG